MFNYMFSNNFIYKTLKINELPKLDKSTKSLIAKGVYSLYLLENGNLGLLTDGGNSCCNKHPQESYILDQEGLVIKKASFDRAKIRGILNFENSNDLY